MKKEAVERIKSMVTPEVTIVSCQDSPTGIQAQIKHKYAFPERPGHEGKPILWIKEFTILADKEGNVYSAPGTL